MSHRIRTITFSLLLALVGADACTTTSEIGASRDAIQNGARERGYPAVGVVHLATSRTFCSGTLIAPNVVLTAAHCAEAGETVDAFFTGAGKPTSDETVDPSTLGMTRHEVSAVALYPGYEYFLYCPNPAPDVALLWLRDRVVDVDPARLGGAPQLHASCRAVGFGQHDDAAGHPVFLEKRSASVKITDVRPGSFDVKAGSGLTDHGDSGGPLYCDDEVVGLTSCLPDFPLDAVTYVSTDAVRAWITSMLAKADAGD